MVFSLITLAIAAPAELVNEPLGVVTMLTVCACAAPTMSHAAVQQAAMRSAVVIGFLPVLLCRPTFRPICVFGL